MKTVCKKLLCLMLVAMMLVSAVPFAFATEGETALFWIEVRVNGEGKDSKQVTMPVNPDADTVLAYAKLDDVWGSYFTEYADYEAKVEELAAGSAAVNFVKAEEPEQKPEQKPEEDKKPEQKPENNIPGRPDFNKPGSVIGGILGNIFNKHDFPGNGHGKPNFKWETVELTVVYNFPDNFRYMGRTSETFKVWKGSDILDALAAAESMGYYEEPTRDGYTLAGYSFDKECKNDVNRDDEITGNLTIYCEWEKSFVTLRVYTNGDTKYPDRTFDLSAYAKDGKITQAEVENLLDSKYTAKSGYTLAYYGLFTDKTWDNGDYDNDDAVSTVKVNAFGKTTIYVMVKNVKKAVADSSNPKTGDNIMIAVSAMALSAAALVSIVELKKRKMI